MPILDTLIVRRPDGHVKLLVYRKETHTDQYLNFDSHHPLQHKLSVIRTLLDRCENSVTDDEDRNSEVENIRKALSCLSQLDWSFKMVQRKMNEGKKRKKRVVPGNSWDVQVVVPYIKELSEACARIYNRYGAKTA